MRRAGASPAGPLTPTYHLLYPAAGGQTSRVLESLVVNVGPVGALALLSRAPGRGPPMLNTRRTNMGGHSQDCKDIELDAVGNQLKTYLIQAAICVCNCSVAWCAIPEQWLLVKLWRSHAVDVVK